MSEEPEIVETDAEIVEQETPDPHAAQLEELNRQAREHLAANAWEPALEAYRQALALAEEAGDVANKAEALNNIASVYLARKEWAEALETLVPARALLREAAPRVPVGTRLGAPTGAPITLVGYTLHGARGGAAAARPGGSVTLDLHWAIGDKLDRDYTVFTHLLGEAHNPRTQGPVWGQHDSQPADGGYPTTQWLVGDVIVDRHVIPVDEGAPDGAYRIEVGLYTVEDGKRLEVRGPDGSPWGDHILLEAPVTVAAP